MKSLTVKQPYAGLIAYGLKTIEVRSQPTKYRGDVLIHAAKTSADASKYVFADTPLYDELAAWLRLLEKQDEFIGISGAAIAIAKIVNCEPFAVKHERVAFVHSQKVGDAYAWHLANVRLIEPIYYRGQLGLINIDFEDKIKVRP